MPKNWQAEFEELKRRLEEQRKKLRELVERSGKHLRESDDRLKSVDRTLTFKKNDDDSVAH